MILELTRCEHCGIVYKYQASGHGCFRPENHQRYCPECAMAVHEALKPISIKRKRQLVLVDVPEEEVKKMPQLFFQYSFVSQPSTTYWDEKNERALIIFDTTSYFCQDKKGVFTHGEVDQDGKVISTKWNEYKKDDHTYSIRHALIHMGGLSREEADKKIAESRKPMLR